MTTILCTIKPGSPRYFRIPKGGYRSDGSVCAVYALYITHTCNMYHVDSFAVNWMCCVQIDDVTVATLPTSF